MPKHKLKKCPQCACSVNSSVSRLIRDACGHKKCRLCLLKEEKGCLACEEKGNSESQESGHEGNPDVLPAVAVYSDESAAEDNAANNPSRTNIGAPAKVIQKNESSEKAIAASKAVKTKKFSLQSHILILPGTPSKYRCTICNKDCLSKHAVYYHNYCGSENKPFKCETCSKGFVTKSHYEYHIKSHKGILPFICSVCGKGFKQKGKLKRHSTKHSGERPFVCQECGKTFGYIESLKSHQRVHRGEKQHVCQLCSRSFIEFSNYKKHVNTVHRGEKAYMCDTCGKTFAIKKTLTIHIAMVHHHERNHVCKICNKPFNLKKDLKRHEIVHSVVRPHSCTLCGIGFRRKDNFERHMKNTHPETRMVIVGTIKQKSNTGKIAPENVEQRDENISNETDEIPEKDIPSPIPPSQTVDIETLRSIPKMSDRKTNLNKARENIPSDVKQGGKINHSGYVETDMQMNYASANPDNTLIQESLCAQIPKQDYKNNTDMQKAPEGSTTPYIVSQEPNSVVASSVSTIYPPKKNVEYYREFSVINRSSNVMNSSVSETSCQNLNISDKQEILKHVEGRNCVPTITRASECVSGSVITRNLQQPISTVLKPISSHHCCQVVDSVPCLDTQVNQPSLRKLLHDVKCSDGRDILNLTNDINTNKNTLFTDGCKQLDDLRFYKQNNVEQSYSFKYSDTYVPETSLQDAANEYPSNSQIILKKYLLNEYNEKVPSETLFPNNQCRQTNIQSLNYDFIPPSYTGYEDDSDDLPQYPPNLSELESRNSTAVNKINVENFEYGTKHFDSDSRSKLFSNITHAEKVSCTQAVGQPVIVGTNKISNNVISSRFSS